MRGTRWLRRGEGSRWGVEGILVNGGGHGAAEAVGGGTAAAAGMVGSASAGTARVVGVRWWIMSEQLRAKEACKDW